MPPIMGSPLQMPHPQKPPGDPMRAHLMQGATGDFSAPFSADDLNQRGLDRAFHVPAELPESSYSVISILSIAAISCFGLLALWLLSQLIF